MMETRDFTLGNIGRMIGNGRTPRWAVIIDGATVKYRDNYGHPQPRTFRTEGAALAWATANLTLETGEGPERNGGVTV